MILEMMKSAVTGSVICGGARSAFQKLGRGIAAAGRRSVICQAVKPYLIRQDLLLEMREKSVLFGAAKWLRNADASRRSPPPLAEP